MAAIPMSYQSTASSEAKKLLGLYGTPQANIANSAMPVSAQQSNFPSIESQNQRPPSTAIPMSSINTPRANVPLTGGQVSGIDQAKSLNTIAQPVSAQQSYQPPDYAALAAARTATALAQKRTIAGQQKAAADASYNKQNLRTTEDRNLENQQINRTLSPFAGKTAYDKGLIGRERTQADADSASALAAQKGNIDQLLADYENATADEQVRIADELKRADQAYQLQLAQVTGTFQGQKTAAQSNADRDYAQNQQQIDYNQNPNNPSNYGQSLSNALNELKLGNYSTEQKQQATLFEQQVKAGQMSNEAAEYNLKQLKDPNSATNQAKALDLQMKQLEAKNLPEQQRLQLQQLKKQIAEIGVVHYKTQTATEIATDAANLKILEAKVKELGNPSSTPVPSKDSTNNLAYYKGQTDNSTHSKDDKLAFAESHQGELTDADYRAWINSINDGD